MTTTISSQQMFYLQLQEQGKKLAVLILLTAFAYTGFAQRCEQQQASVLNIRLSDNSPFKLILDGQQAGDIANRNGINNLPAGRHYIQVYKVGSEWGYETLDNVYRGFITVAPATESFITVSLHGNQLQYDKVLALNQYSRPLNDLCVYPVKPVRTQHPVRPFPTTVCEAPVRPMAMNNVDFEQLKRTISNGSFESTRLNIFKQALAYNYFTTAQVCDLMDQFWFESTKLEVAKISYPKTIDQQNYYLVNNQFGFSSSVNELGEYIAMR